VEALESGEVEITLENAGKEPHQAQLFKLGDGIEIGQLVAKGKEAEAQRDFSALGTFAGGPNAVDPGETQVSVAQLEAGRYAFFCQVPDAMGRAHLALGMVGEVEVTQADEEAEAPSADYSSSAKEFSFELPESWDGTIAFENRGEQPHELQVIGVAEGKTPEDVETWFKAEPGTAGPPSWTTGGGVSVIPTGGTASFEAALEPGTYFAMCFVSDPEKKLPHFALGMMQRFEVT
jgi:plastocyanin